MRQHTEHELQEAHRDLFQEFHQSRAIDTESLPGSVDHLTLLSQHQVSMAYLKQKGRLGQRSLPGPGEQHTHRSHHRHTHTRHTATTNMQASSSATRARSGPMETGVGTQTNGSGERVIYARPHSAKHTASTTAAHTEGTATTSHYARLSRSRDSYTRAVAAEFDAATRDWLRMDLDKPAVKKLLRGRPNGSFYVHSSPRAWAALTMVVNRQLYTRDIENVSDGVRFVRGTYTAPSLLDLVNESHRPSQVDLPACLGKDSI